MKIALDIRSEADDSNRYIDGMVRIAQYVHIVNCAFTGIIHVSSRSGQRLRQLARFANRKCEALVEHDELWQEQPKTHVLHHRCSGVALSSPLLPLHALAQLSPTHILCRIYSCCCMTVDLLVVTCLFRRILPTCMFYDYFCKLKMHACMKLMIMDKCDTLVFSA